jgi:hypothetical protein
MYFLYDDWQDKSRRKEYLKYAGVIAETSVASELYRFDNDSFLVVRDSVFRKYQVTQDEMLAFKDRYKDDERRWGEFWFYVDSLTDSLINYYDSLSRAKDSLGDAIQ